MSVLSYAATAYWKAAHCVRSGLSTSPERTAAAEDLLVILSNLEYPASLYRGAADAMNKALDRGVQMTISDDAARELQYALAERDEMEEERWSDLPYTMADGEPEVRYLRIGENASNG